MAILVWVSTIVTCLLALALLVNDCRQERQRRKLYARLRVALLADNQSLTDLLASTLELSRSLVVLAERLDEKARELGLTRDISHSRWD